MTDEAVEIRLNADAHRFELYLDGAPAGQSRFRDDADVRTFTHTEIDPNLKGHRLGGRLVRAALDQTRADGLQVVPQCPFVRSFIDQHPEYADLVAAA